jgi:opacity protein-like surface antigen
MMILCRECGQERKKAGVGTEYALDPRWSIKAEALYVDLGKRTGIFHGRLETLDTMWIVRAGVNYKFGG